jgi:hypothetical protein
MTLNHRGRRDGGGQPALKGIGIVVACSAWFLARRVLQLSGWGVHFTLR